MPQPSDFRPFNLANTIKGAQDIQFNALTIQGQEEAATSPPDLSANGTAGYRP